MTNPQPSHDNVRQGGSAGPLLVVYDATERNPKKAKAARYLWQRIVRRTTDPELGRTLDPGELDTYFFDGSDASRRGIATRLGIGNVNAVLTLGEQPFNAVTSLSHHLKLRGYGIPTHFRHPTGEIVCVGTYGAGYILAGKYNLARVVETDLLKALSIARHGRFLLPKSYITHPSPEDAATFYQMWVEAGRPPLAFDIETPWSENKDEAMTFEEDPSYTILMCGFAFRDCMAISMPWIPPYIDIMKTMLLEAGTALVWNAKFDVPRLIANGVTFGGEIVDAMLAWHWLEPSLPMGLKFVAPFLCPDMDAWALEKDNDFAKYNCGDADVLLRSFYQIKARLQDQGRWAIFERHFLEFGKILNKMTKRGIMVDLAARRESRSMFEAEFEKVTGEARDMAPPEVRPVHPKKGYKKDIDQLQKAGLWKPDEMKLIEVEIRDEEYAKEQEKVERARAKEAARAAKAAKKGKRKKAQQEMSYE